MAQVEPDPKTAPNAVEVSNPLQAPGVPQRAVSATTLASVSASSGGSSSVDTKKQADETDEAVAKMRWGGTPVSILVVLLLLLTLAVALAYFLFHVSGLIEALTGTGASKGDFARQYVGISLPVVVAVWVLAIPVFLVIARALVQTTCCWRRFLRHKIRSVQKRADHVMGAWSTFESVFRVVDYLRKPESSYFFVFLFLSEANELLWQCLALEQMSRSGYGPVALALYCSFILLNAILAPFLLMRISWLGRISIEETSTARWVIAVLLLDVSKAVRMHWGASSMGS